MSKNLRQRTFVRIACRRMGDFSTAEYREGCRRSGLVAKQVALWVGVAATVVTGGPALGLFGLFMLPGACDLGSWVKQRRLRALADARHAYWVEKTRAWL